MLRTQQVFALGIHPAALYELRDNGQLTQLSCGVYRLARAAEYKHPDSELIGLRAPSSAIGLIFAFVVHGISAQIQQQLASRCAADFLNERNHRAQWCICERHRRDITPGRSRARYYVRSSVVTPAANAAVQSDAAEALTPKIRQTRQATYNADGHGRRIPPAIEHFHQSVRLDRTFCSSLNFYANEQACDQGQDKLSD